MKTFLEELDRPAFAISPPGDAVPPKIMAKKFSIDDLLPSKLRQRRKAMLLIEREVADAFGLGVEILKSRGRESHYSWPRQIVMAFMRQLTSATLNEIAGRYGLRAHASVIHACRLVDDLSLVYPALGRELKMLRDSIRSQLPPV